MMLPIKLTGKRGNAKRKEELVRPTEVKQKQ